MGWWSDRWNSVTSTVSSAASAVSNTVTSTARAAVNIVEDTVDAAVDTVTEIASDAVDAVVDTAVEAYTVTTEAFDNAVTATTTAISEGYENTMVWVSDNVFAEDTWIGKGMNWAADAGDKLSNMYDYMIENPERAFATIGEGLEEGVGYILGTPGYIVDLVAEGGDIAYSYMTGSERSEGFGLGWGNAIASGVDTGFDHVQAAATYSIDHAIFGLDTTYAQALDQAEVKVLNEEEALLKGITIGALEVGLLVATAGGSGAARAGAWTARIAGKADDVARLTSAGTKLSETTARIGSAISTGTRTVVSPFRAAASFPGVAPLAKYAAVGGLFYLNVNGELTAYRVQELQERTAEMQENMISGRVTDFQEREDYVQDLLSRQTDEINQMVEELNTQQVSSDRRAEIVARFEELEAQSDLIEEWQNSDTTGARRDEIFRYLQERDTRVDANISSDVPGLSTERPDGAGALGAQEFNPSADGSEPAVEDQTEGITPDGIGPVEVNRP